MPATGIAFIYTLIRQLLSATAFIVPKIIILYNNKATWQNKSFTGPLCALLLFELNTYRRKPTNRPLEYFTVITIQSQ